MWPELNHRECLHLFRHLCKSTINKLKDSRKYNTVLYSTYSNLSPDIKQRKIVKTQIGKNLGERMHHAVTQELKYSQRVILIGTDCLEFNKQYIENAFNYLKRKNDIVLTPTYDGGYCLIGMTHSDKRIFNKIDWGSENVLTQTEYAATQSYKQLYKIKSIHDIDIFNDLYELNKLDILPHWAQTYIR